MVFTKICFYGSAKIEWKIKVCVMENKGSVAKMIKMKVAEAINILLEHKSIDCLDHFKLYMWTKMYTCTCVCMFTYTCTYGQSTYICAKTWKFSYILIWTHLLCLCQQVHLGICVRVNGDMWINIACVYSYVLMCVLKAVCVHMHMHICIYISHAHMYIYASIHVCTSMPAFMCVLTSSSLHLYIC